MNTRSAMVASVAASLSLGIADACAAPYTAYIEGTTGLYFDYDSFGYVPENAGQTFSAKVTFDVANSPPITSLDPNNPFSLSGLTRGCDRVVNGTCELDSGAQLPVVTDYSLVAPFAPTGGYRPLPIDAYWFDLSSRANSSGANPPTDTYVIERGQERCNVTGDLDGAYTEECHNNYFFAYPTAFAHSMFGSLANLLDLNRTPILTDVPAGQINFRYIDAGQTNDCAHVDQELVCVTSSFLAGGVIWEGSVTSLVVMKEGPATKDACKNGGWKAFGFKNQGQCVKYVNHSS